MLRRSLISPDLRKPSALWRSHYDSMQLQVTRRHGARPLFRRDLHVSKLMERLRPERERRQAERVISNSDRPQRFVVQVFTRCVREGAAIPECVICRGTYFELAAKRVGRSIRRTISISGERFSGGRQPPVRRPCSDVTQFVPQEPFTCGGFRRASRPAKRRNQEVGFHARKKLPDFGACSVPFAAELDNAFNTRTWARRTPRSPVRASAASFPLVGPRVTQSRAALLVAGCNIMNRGELNASGIALCARGHRRANFRRARARSKVTEYSLDSPGYPKSDRGASVLWRIVSLRPGILRGTII